MPKGHRRCAHRAGSASLNLCVCTLCRYVCMSADCATRREVHLDRQHQVIYPSQATEIDLLAMRFCPGMYASSTCTQVCTFHDVKAASTSRTCYACWQVATLGALAVLTAYLQSCQGRLGPWTLPNAALSSLSDTFYPQVRA